MTKLYQLGDAYINVDNILYMSFDPTEGCLVVVLAIGSVRERLIFNHIKDWKQIQTIAGDINYRM